LKPFENRGLMRIFRVKRRKVTGLWRKIYDNEIMMCTLRVRRMIKSRIMKWA
jgi:hypothetical protein